MGKAIQDRNVTECLLDVYILVKHVDKWTSAYTLGVSMSLLKKEKARKPVWMQA